MNRTGTLWNSLANFFIKHAITIFVLATAVCLILVAYITNHLKPNVIGAWVIVGILTSLLFSGVALVVVLAVAAVEKARHLRVITYEPPSSNKLKEHFERERIKIADFYSPFLVLNENKVFKDCEIQGPGSILFTGSSSLADCSFDKCDYIVVKEGDRINTAAHFKNATFTGCKLSNVALFMPHGVAEQVFASYKAATGEALPFVGLACE